MSDWRQLGSASYRRYVLFDELGWKTDLQGLSVGFPGNGGDLVAGETAEDLGTDCVLFLSQLGGPAAVIMTKSDTPNTRSSSMSLSKAGLYMYTAAGSQMARTPWPHFGLLTAAWPDMCTFIAAFKDGTFRSFDVAGDKVSFFNVIPMGGTKIRERTLKLACVGTRYIAAVTSSNEVLINASMFETKHLKVPSFPWKNKEGSRRKDMDIKAIALVDYSPSSNYPILLAVTAGGSFLRLDENGWRVIILQASGSSESSLKIIKIAISQSKRFVALLTDDSFVCIANGNDVFGQQKEESNKDDVSIKAALRVRCTLINSPAISVQQFKWVADHCLALIVPTPTPFNPRQHCLFLGGPSRKWLDYIYPGWVVVSSELDGIRFLSQTQAGLIHLVSAATESVFGPGSCDAAAMLTFAQQRRFQAERSGAAPDQETSTEYISDSSSPEDGDDVEASRNEENFRKATLRQRLRESDLNFFFYHEKWKFEAAVGRLPPEDMSNCAVADESMIILQSLSKDEQREALKSILKAIEEEWDPSVVVILLKSARLCIDCFQHSTIIDLYIRYIQLLRDFRLLFSLRNSPVEMALTYHQLKATGLSRIVNYLTKRRLFDVALDGVNNYRLNPLYLNEHELFKDESDMDLKELREKYRANVKALEKSVSLNCVNVSVSSDPETATLDDSALLDSLVKRIGRIFLSDRVIARQAAWAAMRVSRNQFAKKLMANESNNLIRLYFSQSVKDHTGMLECAIPSLDPNLMDVCLSAIMPFLSRARMPDDSIQSAGDTRSHTEVAIHSFVTAYNSLQNADSIKLSPTSKVILESKQPLLYVMQQIDDNCKLFPKFTTVHHPLLSFCKSANLTNLFLWNSLRNALDQVEAAAVTADEEPQAASTPGQPDVQNSFIGHLMSSPFSSLTAAVLNPQGSVSNAQKAAQQMKQNAFTELHRTLRQMSGHCKSESRGRDTATVEGIRILAPVFSETAELLKFQAEMSQLCKAETTPLSFAALRSNKVPREALAGIEWEGLSLHKTGETLMANAHIIPNGEQKLDEFRAKFGIDKKVLLLWKIRLLASKGHWQEFLDLAIEAVRAVPLNHIYKPSKSSPGSLAGVSLTSALSSAFSLTSQNDQQESGSHFAAYLTNRFAAPLGNDSALTSTISNILSAVPGRQSGALFVPLLPDAGGISSQHLLCPQILPSSLCSRIHVLEFVNVAIKYDRSDIALALVPFISPLSLREKYGTYLGLKDTAQCHKFTQDAIESALARSADTESGNAGFVLRLISKATTANKNPLTAWASSWAPTMPDVDALKLPPLPKTTDASLFMLQQ
eukprot:Blabericola_migrator_1__8026@NODE_411_length_8732_cov_37_171725_g324_i0_p1_GENE_NODE_411_length_8732_cov_37_171725_g324_i0NODE_411_length_8732_cov_37_171725_g324_i0_p1_ORF_typecomplete_len1313_score304_99Vps16_N/PF04841_13/2_5e36Vps16_N/PF04841_13/18Vps16_C/PF04840_12/1_7Vps16_C/PF04840_12/1_2e06Vps16_C/PF04840_12/57Med26/PF08711_11/7_8e03Med26/PF08711_11/0_46_NODE_411_length_8732_cov_37_171725_g324_i020936031